MGQFSRCARASALTVCAVIAAALCAHDVSAAATKGKAKPAQAAVAPDDETAQKQKSTAATHNAYEAGVKSYQSGKFEPAVQSFTAALRGGGLPATDMAHALYYRGLAYKKQSKPGLAISDLTSALWLKNGLSDSERASAASERSEAYRMAGLGDGSTGADQVSVADPNPQTTNAKAAAPSTASATAETGSSASKAVRVARQSEDIASMQAAVGGQTEPAPSPAAAPTPVPRPAEAKAAGSGSGQNEQLLSALNQNAARTETVSSQAPALSAAPVENVAHASSPVTAAASGVPNSISGFFSNMFGGGSATAPPAAAAPVTTASTNTGPTSATSSWSDASATAPSSAKKGTPAKAAQQVAALQTAPAAQPSLAALPVQAQQAAAPQVKGGKYKVHIAAVRSRAEADALAQKLIQQQGAHLLNRTPTVDEAVIGSMGTFYRVRVGSFATAEEPRGLCNTLRTSGFDCLVVTN